MPSQGAPALLQLPMLIFIMVAFYFIILRPQQKKQKEQKEMLESVAKNDEVVTIGGIHGTIVNIKEKTFVLRVDDAAKIEIEKTSVSHIVRKKSQKE